MEFRILGPVEVLEGDKSLSVGGPKQRAILAYLLLRGGEFVPAERVINELWGARPPETVGTMLQVYVSRLRKVLQPSMLVSRPGGYVMRIEPEQLDRNRFERLAAAGRDALTSGNPAQASAIFREALALWRGPALADFAYEPFAGAEIARLEELRLVTQEDAIEAELAVGGHGRAVAELEALVSAYPLRERLRGQLMLALYRSGRQVEALDTFQATRRALVDELGLEPSRTLHDLEKAILRHEPALDLVEATAVVSPPDESVAPRRPFVGRHRELAELVSGFDAAVRGSGGLILLSGEPGIGKSRLADELANRAREHGARILVGRCWEAGGAPAYWPWVQALRSYVSEAEPTALRRQLGRGASYLAQILPELGELFPDLPDEAQLEPDAARFRLFDAGASFLRNIAATEPLILILDDLHAADAPSLLQLQFVASELAQSRVLVVGAYRDVDPTVGEPLSSALVELAREESTRLIALSGLAESDVAELIELTTDHRPAAGVSAAIHQETEGNPLFVGELVRLLAAEGRLADADSGTPPALTLPHSVRAVVGRRLLRLSEDCNRVLAVASVLGREFRLDALAEVAGLAGEELLSVLDDAIAERVVSEVPGTPSRLRFSHAVIRDTLNENLTRAVRVRLHRRTGEALETLYRGSVEPHLAALAYHFGEAAVLGDDGKATEYARRAGDRAVRLLAYEEAVRLYRLALMTLAVAKGDGGQARCELLLALGDAQARAGDEPGARDTFLEAAAAAAEQAEPELLARAALGYGGRFIWARAGTDVHLVPHLQSALAALGPADSPLRVKILTRLAGALRDQHEREPRDALSREAVDMARRLGDLGSLAYALDGRITAIHWPENPAERVSLASELAQVAEATGDRERVAQSLYSKLFALLELGELAEVRARLGEYATLAHQLKQPAQLWLLVVTEATLALFEGRFAEAKGLIEQALSLGERAQSSDAVLSYRTQIYVLRKQTGQIENVEPAIRLSIGEYPARPMFRCMLADLHRELGRTEDARAALAEVAAAGGAELPRTNEWLFSMGFLAEVVAFLQDAERAETMYELLRPYARHNACTADYISTGSVSRYLGILASTIGQFGAAAAHFDDALEMNGRMGARPWVAHTQHDYGRMLLAKDDPRERQQSAELLTRAAETYRNLGMEPWTVRTTALIAPEVG